MDESVASSNRLSNSFDVSGAHWPASRRANPAPSAGRHSLPYVTAEADRRKTPETSRGLIPVVRFPSAALSSEAEFVMVGAGPLWSGWAVLGLHQLHQHQIGDGVRDFPNPLVAERHSP